MSPKPASSLALDLACQDIFSRIQAESSAFAVTEEDASDQSDPSGNLRHALAIEKAISETIERLTQQLHDDAVKLLRRHNSLLPIQRLPPEIGSTIIFHELDGFSKHNRLHRVIQLSSVSCWWRAIILDTPTMWNIIHSTDGKHLVPLALERSRDAPLTIAQHGGGKLRDLWHNYLSSMGEEDFLDLVEPHILRWRDAEFNYAREGPIVERLSGTGRQLLPDLRRFHLFSSVSSAAEISNLTFTFLGPAERLSDLKLSSIAIATESVIQILMDSPRLEVLELESLIMLNPTAESESDNRGTSGAERAESPINLPHLTSISLRSLPSRMMVPLLSSISATGLRDITIEHDTKFQSDVIEEPSRLQAGPFTVYTSRLIQHSTAWLSVLLDSSGITLSNYTETQCRYEIQLKGGHSTLLRWLRHRCIPQLTKVCNIHLEFGANFDGDGADDVLTENLIRLAKVKSLRLRSHSEAWRWVWLLSLPEAMPTSALNSWLWPSLTELTLDGRTINEVATLSMVLGRYGHCGSAGTEVSRPCRLHDLKVVDGEDRWRSEVVQRIRGIIGAENFKFCTEE
ncbi:hypothetical protein FRB90_007336 [Tulasnella sp. 427]|nr:hypothetical protein FRB90_007336 [Tulasnella sp. 427]